ITENNTLEFNVDLIERGGIEKIDVQIKYSIIDKDNNEIFSQIETKAIQGELNYDKRIEEVKLENGEYILRVDILYGNLQRAFAEQKFEIRKEELWTSPAKKFTNKLLIISGSLIILLVLIILILMKRRKGKKRSVVYQRKVKHNLRRIRSKSFSVMLVGFIVIGFLAVFRSKFTGFVVGNPIVGNGNWKIIEFVLVIGVLGLFMFLYRSKIKVLFEWARERIKSEYPKNSVRGLIKKRVCTGEGEYIGNVEEIILEGNKIYGLKIKLDKRFNRKGILIKYNCVKGLGQIVITDAKVLEHLKKLQ
ncbi:MAG: PRC-barrel domain-containing protein, partial [Nanoarchaeota archaeon]|nr:PRC-barrel domain-containing protein [Nanoarchaeota archaeon]